MSRVILPAARRGSKLAGDCIQLVLDMERAGVSVFRAYPQLIRLQPRLLEERTTRLRMSLHSLAESEVHAAVAGVYWWLVESLGAAKGNCPDILLRDIVTRFLGRLQPSLADVTEVLAHAARFAPRRLFPYRNDICAGLEILHKETKLPTERDRLLLRDPIDLERVYELPKLQIAATRLAAWMRLNVGNCAGVDVWAVEAERTRLPEVMRSWMEAKVH